MMSHLGDRLHGYIDGELSPEEAKHVEAHLVTCEECREEWNVLRRMVNAAAEPEPVSDETARRFIAENRLRRAESRRERAAKRRRFPVLESSLLLAASLFIAGSIFVALGGPLRNMFSNAVGTQTMGQNQAALSAGIY